MKLMERVEIPFLEDVNKLLKEDVLLCTRSQEGKVNIMTLTYKTLGILLGDPCLSIYISPKRYTTELLLSGIKEFTISRGPRLSEYIYPCGNFSGKDIDKVKEFSIPLMESKHLKTPILQEAEVSYECQVVGNAKLNYLMDYCMFTGLVVGAYRHSAD
ncbi:MAG: flavin reductase [Leptospiraceae bacterium]|nr:flavin reductase [Leptospiraceae bacterium]